MNAEFLAAVQILIYIGAISVLLIFAILFTRDIDIQNWPKERLSNCIETLLDEIAVIDDETGRSEKKI